MSSIDQRIVEMVFDNKEFEKGVGTTLDSIDKLDSSLQFQDVGKGITNLASLGDSVDTISDRFSTLGIVAMTALENITNKAVDAGIRLIESLTVDQLADGFKKYESSVSNVKAIMNQSGESLGTVEGYIDQLSWYADQTSFSFNDMTTALKTFTQQGISLDKAIPMIMGIGNAVTYTGVGAKEGSQAFTYYAKAISAGYMTTKEWQSISRTLGASSVGLKKQFMEAAVAANTLRKTGEDTYVTANGLTVSLETFDSTLGHVNGKWLTTEVMMDVLGGSYGSVSVQLKELMDQYEAETGEILTLQEATEKFADQLDETAVKYALSATEAKTFTEAIDATKDAVSSQFQSIFESVFGNTEEAIVLWSDLNSYLVDTFATPFANAAKLAEEWKKVGGREDLINSFWNITDALGNVGEAIKSAWHSVFPAKGVASLKAFTEKIEQATEKLKDNEVFIEKFKIALTGVFSAFNIIKKVLKAVFTGLSPLVIAFKEQFSFLGDKINEVATRLFKFSVGNIGNNFEKITEKVAAFSSKIVEFFNAIYVSYIEGGGGLGGIVEVIFDSVADAFRTLISIIEKLTDWDLSGVEETIITPIQKIRNKIVDLVNAIKDSGFVTAIKDFFASFGAKGETDELKEKVTLLDKFKTAIEKLKAFLAPATEAVKTFFETAWTKLKEGFSNLSMDNLIGALGGAAVAGGSISVISLINSLKDKINGVGDIKITLLDNIANSFSGFVSKINDAIDRIGGGDTFGDMLKKVATAILILAAAMFVLATISPGKLAASTAAVTAFMFELASMTSALGSSNKTFSKVATGLLKVSAAILIIAFAMKTLSNLNSDQIFIGVLAVGIILAELGVFTQNVGGSKNMAKVGTGLALVGAAVLIIANAVEKFANMDSDALAQGIIGITVLISALGLFTKTVGGSGKMVSIGVGFIAIAASMLIFADAVKKLGEMDARTMAQGLSSMAIVLTEVAVALGIIPAGALIKAASLVVMAIALKQLANVIAILGGLDIKVVKQGLGTMAIALAEFALALAIMDGTLGGSAALLVAALALAVLCPVIKSLGSMQLNQVLVALVALAGVFTVLGLAGMALKPVIGTILLLGAALALIGVGVFSLSAGLLVLALNVELICASLPVCLAALIEGIGAVIKSFANLAADLIEAVVIIINAILDALIATIPKFAELTITVITALCDIIIECTPKLIETVGTVVVAVLEGLATYVPQILEAIWHIFVAIFEFFKEKSPEWKEKGEELIGKVKDGIKGKVDEVVESIRTFVSDMIQAIKDKVEDFKQLGIDTIQGFINGFKEKINEAKDWAQDLGSKVIASLKNKLGINSPSKEFTEIGRYSIEGLSVGLNKYSRIAENSAVKVGEDVTDSLTSSFSDIADVVDGNVEFNPEVRPVLDLTDIQNGSKDLETAFGSKTIRANLRGRITDYESQQALNDELNRIKTELQDALSDMNINPGSLSDAIRNALSGSGVYMDGTRVGKLVTTYQSNNLRAVSVTK